MKKVIDYSAKEIIFYKFICNDPTISNTYVGHTTNFTNRKYDHKQRCKTIEYQHILLYKTIIENGGWDNWSMFEIERKIVASKQDALKHEQYLISLQVEKLNMCKSFLLNKQEYYTENREEILQKKHEYYIKNKEALCLKHKIWYANNKEKSYESSKEWRDNNKDYIAQKNKVWREQNHAELLEKKKIYYHQNKEQLNLKKREKTIAKKEINQMAKEDKYYS